MRVASAKAGARKHTLTSPTYTLVHEHRRDDGQRLYHLDCYRLESAEDVDSIGFDDVLDSDGIVLIEWAERIMDAVPEQHLWVELRVIEATRRNLLLEGNGERHVDLVSQFREQTFGV